MGGFCLTDIKILFLWYYDVATSEDLLIRSRGPAGEKIQREFGGGGELSSILGPTSIIVYTCHGGDTCYT